MNEDSGCERFFNPPDRKEVEEQWPPQPWKVNHHWGWENTTFSGTPCNGYIKPLRTWVDDNQLEVNHHFIWLVKCCRWARCMVYLTISIIKINHSCTLEVTHHFINGGSFRMINPDLKEWWFAHIKNGGWTSRVYLRPWIRWFANVP